MKYITEQLAEFIEKTNYDDLPLPVIQQAKERIMDTLGSALAGSCNWEYAEKIRNAIKNLGIGDNSVIGNGDKVFSTAHAAMISSTYAHAIELDDGHKNAGCHAGAVVVPTALILGRALKSTGAEILNAVVLGYEITYRIAVAVRPHLINMGFHPSSNCGVYGAMAVAGKLLKLNAVQIANGLGQAGMLASGTMEATHSGQMSKCVQVGNASYNGIMAAYLAQTDMEGCLSALEGKDGMFNIQSKNVDVENVCQGLGEHYLIADTYNKMYPTCRHAQPGIEAVIDLVQKYNIKPEDVSHIQIGTHQVAYDLTGKIKAPQDAGEAKFSLAYGAAVALREHSFGVKHLMEESFTDKQNIAFANLVDCNVSDTVQAVYPKRRGAIVTITLKDGNTYEKELYDLKGSPENPVGWSELESKYKANVGAVLTDEMVEETLKIIKNMDKEVTIESLMKIIA